MIHWGQRSRAFQTVLCFVSHPKELVISCITRVFLRKLEKENNMFKFPITGSFELWCELRGDIRSQGISKEESSHCFLYAPLWLSLLLPDF